MNGTLWTNKAAYKMNVARKPIELGNQHRRLGLARGVDGRGELRAPIEGIMALVLAHETERRQRLAVPWLAGP
jgi:hypothetical protein